MSRPSDLNPNADIDQQERDKRYEPCNDCDAHYGEPHRAGCIVNVMKQFHRQMICNRWGKEAHLILARDNNDPETVCRSCAELAAFLRFIGR